MTVDSGQHIAQPAAPRKPNSVDRLEIPLMRRRSSGLADDLPEDTLYIDRGCGDGCQRSLECPFPRCRYDEPLVSRRQNLLSRDGAIVRARVEEGLPIATISERFNVGTRTIYRALQSARVEAEMVPDTRKRER